MRDFPLSHARCQCPNLSIEGIFTHFATADEADKSRTNVQYEKFSSFTDRVEKELSLKIPLRHCSNSASILELPDMHMDAVRAGIILYGMWPSDEVKRDGIVLEPLLSLKSRIAYIKELECRAGNQLRRDVLYSESYACGDDSGGLCGRLSARTFQQGRCSDCRKARKDPGTRLHGSVQGRCDKDS